MSEALKPCPFCGGRAQWFKSGQCFGVECSNSYCDVQPETEAVSHNHKADAAKTWNTRPGEHHE